MSLGKGRKCAETCLDLLNIELVNYYSEQKITPPQAAIDAIGFRVGRQLVDRYTASRPRLGDDLDVIKFICKEFWHELFHKQVDNLRTNKRGTYVLKDSNFGWLQRLSTAPGDPKAGSVVEIAKDYLHLPCAMIRGALVHMGVECSVTAEAMALENGGHSCDFTVSIKPK